MTDSQKLDLLLSEMKEVKTEVCLLKEKAETLETRTLHMELMLENEIRVNIQRVAEGHLDLSRIFHEAMEPNSEVEMLALRVGMLEPDMRKVKAKLA